MIFGQRERDLRQRLEELEKELEVAKYRLAVIEIDARNTLAKITNWGDDAGAHLIRGALSRIHEKAM